MPNVILRTKPYDYRGSVDVDTLPLLYPEPTWKHSPDVSLLIDVPRNYWKDPPDWEVPGAAPVEMTQPEKDAVDAAEAAALVTTNRSVAVDAPDNTQEPIGWETRALIELLNKRDNYLVNRIVELQNVVHALITDGAFAASKIAAETQRTAGAFMATATRPRADAIQDYKDDINAGGADS